MVTGIGVVSAQSSDNGNLAEEYAFKTHDDLLLEVHNLAPGFGGMFLSDDNTILYAWMLDPSEGNAAKEALEQVFGDWMTEGLEFQAIQGQYDIGQLHEWYSRKRDAVWGIPGVHMTDLDEGDNQLEIRVDDPAAIEEVEEALSSLDIPLEAVNVKVGKSPILAKPSPQEAHTLEQRASGDTMVGGYMTTGSGLGGCTLGFNTTRAGKAGFITAGHCTQTGKWDGGVQGTKFYQPSKSVNPTVIGQEKTDPPASSAVSGCPSGHVCRYSDSTFIEYESGASYELGNLAQPARKGSTAVNSTDRFRIVKCETVSRSNDTVHKVGRKSGWTSGRVSSTCTDLGYQIRDLTSVSVVKEVKLLCQGEVRGISQVGDSGSSVFRVTNSPNQDDVELLGVLWAGHPDPNNDGDTADQVFYFSKIGNIYRELSLTDGDVWNSCDLSLGC